MEINFSAVKFLKPHVSVFRRRPALRHCRPNGESTWTEAVILGRQ